MNLFFKQFNILLWKCWLIKKRHFISTFFEFFLPLLTSIILVCIASKFNYKEESNSESKNSLSKLGPIIYKDPSYNLNENLKVSAQKNPYYLISPSNDCVVKTMKKFQKIYSKKIQRAFNFQHKYFENEKKIDFFFEKRTEDQFYIGLVFNDDCEDLKSFLNNFSIKIKTLSSEIFNIAVSFPDKTGEPNFEDTYLKKELLGFVDTQILINQAHLELTNDLQTVKKKLKIKNLLMFKYPYPEYSKITPLTLIDYLPIILINGFIVLFPIIVKSISSENYTRVREMFKLMGLNDWAYFGSTFVHYFIEVFLQTIILTFLFTYPFNGKMSFFKYTSPYIIFIVILSYTTNLIFLAILIAIPFKKPVIATVVSLLIYILMYMLNYIVNPNTITTVKTNSFEILQLLSCLLPNVSINFMMKILSIKETYGSGCNFSNLFETTYKYTYLSIGSLLFLNLISILVCSIFIWYLDAVCPWQHGIIKPWYFPFNFILRYFTDHKKIPTNFELRKFQTQDYSGNLKICIQNVFKQFKSVHEKKDAVSNLNLNLYENELTALLGHNGAGKTTLMKMITGFIKPSSGKILINNFDMQTNSKKARKFLSFCPQHDVLYDELTAEEHLYIYGLIKGTSTKDELKDEIDTVLEQLLLKSKKNEKSQNYSGGMKRKLNLAIALIGKSKIVILDEPTSGMDVQSRRFVWDVLLKEKRNRTILMTTHFIEEADVLGDKIFIMSNGKGVSYGTPIFLKKKFGIGYQLRIAKDLKFNENEETKKKLQVLIKKYFENCEIMNENSGEIIFALNNSESNNNSNQKLISSFFIQFEKLKNDLHISTFGITVPTLEDVFLKILDSNSSSNKNIINSTNEFNSSDNDDTAVNLAIEGYSTEPIITYNNSNEKFTRKFDLTCQRFKGLIIKRLHHSRRYFPMIILQIVVPVFIFCLIFKLDGYLKPDLRDRKLIVLDSKQIYGSLFTFFKNNNKDITLLESYKKTSMSQSIDVTNIDWSTDINDYFLKKIKEISFVSYIEKELFGLAVEETSDGINLNIHYNNEAYHSLPLSIKHVYQALTNYIDQDKILNNQKITLINQPFPNQNNYKVLNRIILSLMTIWSLLISITLPFIAASYSMFPIHELVTKSKLLQKISGVSSYLYWSTTFIYDFVSHIAVCLLVIIVFYVQDVNGIFINFYQSIYGLIGLLILFGSSSMQVSYIFSRLFSSISTGYLIIVIINLISGIILATIDLILVFSVNTDLINQSTYDFIIWIFRLFPVFATSKGIINLYKSGSKSYLCDDSLSTRNNPSNDCPFDYNNPFSWSSSGILKELFSLFITSILFYLINLIIEEKFFETLVFKMSEFIKHKNKSLFNHDQKQNENNEKDIDVLKEKKRVETLVECTKNRKFISQPMVVHQLSKVFENHHVVRDLSFALEEQECFGLLGVNGAGKTTTFKMLVGDLKPSYGTAYISFLNLNKNLQDFQDQIGYCPQFDALIDNLTCEETLYLYGRLKGIKPEFLKNRVHKIIEMIGLQSYSNRICQNYSGGTKRKLCLGIALIGYPRIIFLDEPSSGVDSQARKKIWNTLIKVKKQFNSSIVLTSHSMDECEALCSRIAIMVNGEFKCVNSVQNLREKYGKGFTLSIKLKEKYIREEFYINDLKLKISDVLESSVLLDFHETLLSYQIADKNLKWSFLFTCMDEIKNEFDLEYYLLSETTLEQIFLNFAKTFN